MKPKVYIIYHYFPHYRLPILIKLSNDPEITYTFFSGIETDIEIQIIDGTQAADNNLQWRKLGNIWLLGKKILWQAGAMKICLLGDYDCLILLANPYIITNWICIMIAKARRKKVLLWGHFILRKQLVDHIKTFLYRLADGLLLYGNWARDRLITLGFNPKKLFVVYNSLDYEEQVNIRSTLTMTELIGKRNELFRNPELPVLIFVGRLTKRKKLDQLINAAVELHARDFPVNVLLIGDGEARPSLEEMVVQCGMSAHTIFYGETYDEKVLALLIALSDVCVSPGDVGLTAMHSMVYGTPVITHDNPYFQMPEFEAILPGITGMLFKHNSTPSLADSIIGWVVSNHTKREEVRQNCYRIIDEKYNPDYQSKIINSAIISVMDDTHAI